MTQPVDTFSVEALGASPNADPATVIAGLAQAFRIPEDNARTIVERAPVRVKTGVDPAVAKKLSSALLRAGLDVRIVNDRTGADRTYRASELDTAPPSGVPASVPTAAAAPVPDRLSTPMFVIDRPAGADALAKLIGQGRVSSPGPAPRATSAPAEPGVAAPAAEAQLAAAEDAAAFAPQVADVAPAAAPGDEPLAAQGAPPPAAEVAEPGAAFASPPEGVAPSEPAGVLGLEGAADASGAHRAAPEDRPSIPTKPPTGGDPCLACKRFERDRSGICRHCGWGSRDRQRHCKRCGKAPLEVTTVLTRARRPVALGAGVVIAVAASLWMFVGGLVGGLVFTTSIAALLVYVSGTAAWTCKACGARAEGFAFPAAEEAPIAGRKRAFSMAAAVAGALTLVQLTPYLFRPTLSAKGGKASYSVKAGRMARDLSARTANVHIPGGVIEVSISEAQNPGGRIEYYMLGVAKMPGGLAKDATSVPASLAGPIIEGTLNGSVTGAPRDVPGKGDDVVAEADVVGSVGTTDAHTLYGKARIHVTNGDVVVVVAGGGDPSAPSDGAVASFLTKLGVD